ncbi:hypothetical protein FRC08_006406 [Ceratobasidium sp. 394]|nr:hypothetical protein FRC08_006406 [Ceratobasidium sp. 394]KAG9084810.1 hypothetical protein FS749_004938 [Ceratobasidium sp. UAMH 11750]
MPLEYPVTREYTIPHLAAYLSLVSVVAIAALTVLNVILQGYDIVTVLRPDPNVTESYWWSIGPLPGRFAGGCNPVSLSKKMSFSTNSSFFSYEVRSAFDANNQDIAGASSYVANPLNSCTVDAIAAVVDIGRRTYTFDIPILCTGSDLPFSLSLISRFSLNQYNPYYDDVMAYYIRNKPARKDIGAGLHITHQNASSPANIIGILDAMSTDFMAAFWLLGNASKHAIPATISTGGFLACPGENATCHPEDMRMKIPTAVLTYPDGTYSMSDGVGSYLAPIERSFLNIFTVLQDAYHIDLGNIKPDNTLLNKDAFSARIQPDPTLAALARNVTDFSLCGWGAGCIQGSTWVEQLLVSNPKLNITVPSILPTGNSPVVAKIDYLCPEFRIKRPGSLITSVFTGTWTMYAALFGAFGFIGPILEKWYSRRRAAKVRGAIVADNEHASTWNPLTRPEWDLQHGGSDTRDHQG